MKSITIREKTQIQKFTKKWGGGGVEIVQNPFIETYIHIFIIWPGMYTEGGGWGATEDFRPPELSSLLGCVILPWILAISLRN